MSNFDKKEEFNKEVAPILSSLREACERIGLPVLVAVTGAKDDSKYTVFTGVANMDARAPMPLLFAAKCIQNMSSPGFSSLLEQCYKAMQGVNFDSPEGMAAIDRLKDESSEEVLFRVLSMKGTGLHENEDGAISGVFRPKTMEEVDAMLASIRATCEKRLANPTSH